MADPTLNPVTLQQVLKAAADEFLARHDKPTAKPKAAKPALDWSALTIAAFKKAGFKDIKPRENVLTYDRWIQAGRKVRPGEKAIKVRQLRLWHISQTEKLVEPVAKPAKKAKGKPQVVEA